MEAALGAINPRAECTRATNAAVKVEWVLARAGFDAAAAEELNDEHEQMICPPASVTSPTAPVLTFGKRPANGAFGISRRPAHSSSN